jgi:hypothetical protein
MRRYKKAGKSQEDIQKLVGNAKMGVAMERVSDPKAAMMAKFQNMTPEEKTAFLAQLKDLAKG